MARYQGLIWTKKESLGGNGEEHFRLQGRWSSPSEMDCPEGEDDGRAWTDLYGEGNEPEPSGAGQGQYSFVNCC